MKYPGMWIPSGSPAVWSMPTSRTRSSCVGEEPFPCRKGDWVQLADGRVGRIVTQNPAHVVVEELGGAAVAFPTPDFLSFSPKKLSTESFRVETRFGIDYKHQKDCTTKIPKKMETAVRKGVEEIVGSEAIQKVAVQFACAGASSLDYEVEVDLGGEAAELYEELQYALQRILVDCCNENGWVIPFQQVTIHRSS